MEQVPQRQYQPLGNGLLGRNGLIALKTVRLDLKLRAENVKQQIMVSNVMEMIT